MEIYKEYFFKHCLPILITSLLSAGIAILQGILANYGHTPEIKASPEVAGLVGLTLKSIQHISNA